MHPALFLISGDSKYLFTGTQKKARRILKGHYPIHPFSGTHFPATQNKVLGEVKSSRMQCCPLQHSATGICEAGSQALFSDDDNHISDPTSLSATSRSRPLAPPHVISSYSQMQCTHCDRKIKKQTMNASSNERCIHHNNPIRDVSGELI